MVREQDRDGAESLEEVRRHRSKSGLAFVLSEMDRLKAGKSLRSSPPAATPHSDKRHSKRFE